MESTKYPASLPQLWAIMSGETELYTTRRADVRVYSAIPGPAAWNLMDLAMRRQETWLMMLVSTAKLMSSWWNGLSGPCLVQ